MRRIGVLVLLGLWLSACATPPIRLTPSYPVGEIRTYRLTTDATTTVDVGSVHQEEKTSLSGRSSVQILSVTGNEATVRVTLTPERFSREGVQGTAPPEQSAELVLGRDGGVRKILSVQGLAPEVSGGNIDDLAPLLGARMPTRRLHLGDRWTFATGVAASPSPSPGPSPTTSMPTAGEEQGRLFTLRTVDDYDCAIVRVQATRPIERSRTFAGQPVRLAGVEHSAGEIAFAFREGFPVTSENSADSTLRLEGAAFAGGTVRIQTTTSLQLVEVRQAPSEG